jgi:hypothetical protein
LGLRASPSASASPGRCSRLAAPTVMFISMGRLPLVAVPKPRPHQKPVRGQIARGQGYAVCTSLAALRAKPTIHGFGRAMLSTLQHQLCSRATKSPARRPGLSWGTP